MSNGIKNMQKVPDLTDHLRQRDLQKQSIIVNTRFQLSSAHLNTLLGRPDVDLNSTENLEVLVDISVDAANLLMAKLGMITVQKTNA